MRPLDELIDPEESAWPLVQQWIEDASVPVEVLPADPEAGRAALHATQVTTRSPMGAIACNAAGMFIDHGWLRVLGAGMHPRLRRSLPGWNAGRSNGYCLVADDAIGGFFAINGGALGDDVGDIHYYAPDTLEWEPCGFGFSQFLVWAMSKSLQQFYESMRWDGWTAEVARLSGDQAISVYPFLYAEGPPVGARHRRSVAVDEQWSLHMRQQ